jgi:hypothetical protein
LGKQREQKRKEKTSGWPCRPTRNWDFSIFPGTLTYPSEWTKPLFRKPFSFFFFLIFLIKNYF